MQSFLKMVACLLRVHLVTFYFSIKIFLSELQPIEIVAMPVEIRHGQYTIGHDTIVW